MAERFGLLARFDGPVELIAAVRALHEAGYRRLDAYTPYPVAGLPEALHEQARWVSRIALTVAVLAPTAVYFMQWYSAVVDYPFVVGGKPLHSWPAFMLVTFVCLLLGGVLGAVIGMLVTSRLPRPYHPVFNVDEFARASDDAFFLLVGDAEDESGDGAIRGRLESLGAASVTEVTP